MSGVAPSAGAVDREAARWSGGTVRTEIHVRPGASATTVGGEYDGALVVRVVEPPEGGRATDGRSTPWPRRWTCPAGLWRSSVEQPVEGS